jgi:hypothetical protein
MASETLSKNAEILKLAREQLVSEFITQRAEDHLQWLRDADEAWRTKGALLPYPIAPLYPSEADILSRAIELSKTLSVSDPSIDATTTQVQPAIVVEPVSTEANTEPAATVGSSIATVATAATDSIMERFNRLRATWSKS